MDLLTLQQAMQRLGISDSTMRRYMKKKKIPYQKIEGRYYFHESDINKLLPKQSNTQEAISEIFNRVSNIEQEIEALKQQISQLTSQQANLSTHVNEIIEALYSISTPPPAQPRPTTRTEQAKPSVAHPGAIVGQPPNTITLQELAERVQRNKSGLLGHLKKWDRDPERYPQFEHIRVPVAARPGWFTRYFTEEQAERISVWIAANTNKSGD